MTGTEAIQDRENKRLCAALEVTRTEQQASEEALATSQSVTTELRKWLLESEGDVTNLRVILADIIRTLSEKDLADVKFERARKKGINYCFEKGTA